MRRTLVLTCAFATLAAGCASGGGGSSTSAVPMPSASSGTTPQTTSRGSSNMLTYEEVKNANVSNAFEAVQRLRPAWLRSRGVTSARSGDPSNAAGSTLPVVYLDNSQLGDINTLQNIPSANIGQIQYLNAGDATQRFGTNHTGGAIIVTSKH